MNFKKLGTALLAGFTLATAASPLAVSAQETIKVGGNFEQSGAVAAYGTPMAEGMQLAIDQVNEKGGINGQKVEAIIVDNKSDKAEVAAVQTKLISQGVSGIIGAAATGNAIAAGTVANENQVPDIYPAATGDGITLDSAGKVLEYIYRVCFQDSFQGVAAANYMYNTLGVKKVAVVTDQANDYSTSLAAAFEKQFTAKGGEVVAKESYQTNDTDFQTILTNLLTKEFDALYLPGYYTEAGLIIKQARELGIDKAIVGGDGIHNDTLVQLAGKENLNNVYFTSHYAEVSQDKEVQDFVKAYEAKYGKKPDTFAALSYDATNMLLKAIETAKSSDPKEVNKALAQTKDFKGVTGSFTIGEDHNPIKTVLMLKMENGEITGAEQIPAE